VHIEHAEKVGLETCGQRMLYRERIASMPPLIRGLRGLTPAQLPKNAYKKAGRSSYLALTGPGAVAGSPVLSAQGSVPAHNTQLLPFLA
jgi:hypothetical protein